MAIKVSVHRTCDRCAHVFDESRHMYGDELPKFQLKSLSAQQDVGSESKVLFEFFDLCPECERVVDGLIKRIRMDPDSDEKAPRRRKTEKTPLEVPESAAEVIPQVAASVSPPPALDAPAVFAVEASETSVPVVRPNGNHPF